MQCPNIIDVFISEPCDSLSAFTSVLSNVNCWGDSTGKAYVSAFGGAEPWTYSYQWHNAPFGINNLGESNDTVSQSFSLCKLIHSAVSGLST